MNLTVLTAACHRPEAWTICEKWITRQTFKPFQWLVVDSDEIPTKCTMGQEYYYWPELNGHGNMVNKIKRVLELGLIKGDALVFAENDDFYAPDYLQWCAAELARHDLVGECCNLYYNVRHRWWFEHANRLHASLCATSMRRSVFPQLLKECEYSLDPFIDSRLWANCVLSKHTNAPSPGGVRRSVGIKAMPGTKGYGSGHDRTSGWAKQDPELRVLRSLIGADADLYAGFYDSPKKTRRIAQADALPVVEVHLVAYNEELILPYTIRHYKTFASRIIVHDGGSTDLTPAICREFGVEVVPWDTAGQINDELLKQLKETAWQGTDADWVIMADADELIYFPNGAESTFLAYEKVAQSVIKPHGFEMVSETLPAGPGQIYDEIKHGGRDDRWYAKPILFSPKRVTEITFSAGAHECRAIVNGSLRVENPIRFSEPPCWLLHFKHIGPVERVGVNYDGNKRRFSEANKKHGWGWHGDGLVHAREKRAAITKTLHKVVP